MDMEYIPTTIAGYRILNGHYALQECMAISSVGKIYRGRDLQQIQTRGMDSRILVHLLPEDAGKLPIEALFQQLSKAHKQAACHWIMAPRTYGQDGDTAYIVLESPDERQLSSLAAQPHFSNRAPKAYQCLNQHLQTLHKQGYLGKQVDPTLLLSSTGEQVYLLGTALSPEVQSWQTAFLPKPTAKRRLMHSAFVGAGLLTLTALSAIAGNYVNSSNGVTPTAAAPVTVAQPKQQLAMLTPETQVHITQLSNSDRMPEARQEPLKLAPAATVAKPMLIPTAQTNAPKAKLAVLHPMPKPPKAAPKQGKPRAAPVKNTLPAVDTVPDTSAQPAMLGIDALAQRANTAIAANRLDDAQQYAQAIRTQAHLHPQVSRLGDAIVARYHQQARTALEAGNAAQAQHLLGASKRAIKDFNLSKANPGQEVLEHKTAQFQ